MSQPYEDRDDGCERCRSDQEQGAEHDVDKPLHPALAGSRGKCLLLPGRARHRLVIREPEAVTARSADQPSLLLITARAGPVQVRATRRLDSNQGYVCGYVLSRKIARSS